MAFPVIEATTVATSAGHPLVMNYPTIVDADDLIVIAVWGNGSSATFNITSGYTELADHGAVPGGAVFYRIADGTEDGGTQNVDMSPGASCAGVMLRISGAHTTTAPEISTGATGTSTSPDPASLNPSGWDVEDTMWLAILSADHDAGGETVDSYPSGYTQADEQIYSASGVVAIGYKNSRAASEDPGTFTISNSQQWVAYTLGIRPAVPGSGSGQTGIEVIGNYYRHILAGG